MIERMNSVKRLQISTDVNMYKQHAMGMKSQLLYNLLAKNPRNRLLCLAALGINLPPCPPEIDPASPL